MFAHQLPHKSLLILRVLIFAKMSFSFREREPRLEQHVDQAHDFADLDIHFLFSLLSVQIGVDETLPIPALFNGFLKLLFHVLLSLLLVLNVLL